MLGTHPEIIQIPQSQRCEGPQLHSGEYVSVVVCMVIIFIALIALYVLFFKWVFEGNLDLPRFGLVSSVIFNCFPERRKKQTNDSESVEKNHPGNITVEKPASWKPPTGGLEDDNTEVLDI